MNLISTFLANAADFQNMAYGDKMMLGLTVTGIGILMVFIILILIILSIYLMNLVLDKIVPKIKLPKKNKKEDAKAIVEVDKVPVEPIYEEVDDKKIIACISAAVMQMLEDENNGRKPNISFRINSIKKVK